MCKIVYGRIICENWETLKDKFRTKPMDFADKFAAFEWMYRKQLGRRNLSDEQKKYMIGKMYEARKKSHGNNAKRDESGKYLSAQNEHTGKPNRTATVLAEELGIGKETVKRSEKFAKGVDAIREDFPETAIKILKGGSGATKKLLFLPFGNFESPFSTSSAIRAA